MDFSKSKVLLKKINALHESAEAFDQNFSTLERDLMLQYLRDLYACVLGKEEKNNSDLPKSEDKTAKKDKIKVDLEEPIVERIDNSVKNDISNGHFTESVVAAPNISTAKKAVVKSPIKPELEALFYDAGQLDDSNRFGNIPVKDVEKSMGINERILTINELFNGDQRQFQEVAQKLNSMASYEEATEFLQKDIAEKNEWSSDKKRKKAEIFLNIVRRRYI